MAAFLKRLAVAVGLRGRGGALDEELESHIAMHAEALERAGVAAAEARRRALVELGGVAQTAQAYREREGLPWLEDLAQDVRFALRMLVKHPGFTVVATVTLALGIGANTILFSVVHAVLLNPLPFPHPEELVTVNAAKPHFSEGSVSYPNFRDWQKDNATLAGLAISRGTGFVLSGLGDAEELQGRLITSDFFPLLGVKAKLGRLFAEHEDEVGGEPLALVSEGFWARKLGRRADAIGRTLTLDGRNYTVVGVVPGDALRTLAWSKGVEVYLPLGQFQNPALTDRAAGLGLHGIARMKPGVTLRQAQADLTEVSARLERAFPTEDAGIRAKLVPFQESLVRDVRPLLWLLMGAVGFVLLIACVNVANLMLARASGRAQEFSVRAALGASRARLVRQMCTESLVLAGLGGAAGIALAALGTRAALEALPQTLPRAAEVGMSGWVLAFTVTVSLLSGLLFGLAPALSISRQDVQSTLKAGGRAVSGTRHRLQDGLVVAQIASALVLLAGAGLMVRSLAKVSQVDPGFRSQGVLNFGMEGAPAMRTASPAAVRAYLRAVEGKLTATPDVAAASFSWAALPMQSDDEQLFWREDEPKPASQNAMHWSLRYLVGPQYLRVMGIPLLRGRFLAETDDEGSPRVVVVDDVFAREMYPGQEAVGKRIHLEQFAEPATIVGVVGHVKQWGLDSDATNSLRAQTYQSLLQMPDQVLRLVPRGADVLVRSKSGAVPSFKAMQGSLAALSGGHVIYNPQSLEQVVSDSMAPRRFTMVLLGVFAGLALGLASLGMYGVMSHLVGQRSREIGIRMALGADVRRVLRWVLARAGRLALLGAGTGMVLSLVLGRWLGASLLLYGVKAHDPLTLLGVTGLMLGIALVAAYLPARRAARIDPVESLRAE